MWTVCVAKYPFLKVLSGLIGEKAYSFESWKDPITNLKTRKTVLEMAFNTSWWILLAIQKKKMAPQ